MTTTATHVPARNFPLFAGLDEKQAGELLAGGRTRTIKRNSHIFMHGDRLAGFYMITQGTVQLFRETPDGYEKTIEVLKAGQSICEGEIMDGCPTHRTSARAIDDVTLLEFPVPWLKDAAKKHGNFALNLLSMISAQAHLAELEAEHQATMSAAQLVACFVQRLCTLYDFDPNGFDLPYSKTLIASRLGMELETFSRTLGKLKDCGIMVKGNHVSIYNLDLIHSYVCDFCSVARECKTHERLGEKMCKSTKTKTA